MKLKIQILGQNLSNMILPNIGAFIAWGLLTALFIPTGWMPNEEYALIIKPMALYLLPILIAFSGGRMVYGVRGGVIGATATFGLIVGADVPMFVGAMIMGPISATILKEFDRLLKNKVPSGFEMLTQNFSAGLIGLSLTLIAYKIGSPVSIYFNDLFANIIAFILKLKVLPLTAIVIEPAKILFLNNVINHGVLSPVGLQETLINGQSILFLLETNPGPGLGVLMTYWVFGNGVRKQSAPGAAIIHFFGGIHEVYFPYILSNPFLILPMIIGSGTGILIFTTLGLGLTATPSPGSIVSILTLAPKGQQIGILLGIIISALVTFVLSAKLIKKTEPIAAKVLDFDLSLVKNIAFACDAGMGSSAMGANKFEKAINNKAIKVIHCQIDHIPEHIDLVITHKRLKDRVNNKFSLIEIDDFLESEQLNYLIDYFKIELEKEGKEHMLFKKKSSVLTQKNIYTDLNSVEKFEAIKQAGIALNEAGFVDVAYIDAMAEREKIATTYIGSNVAIPHGTSESKSNVKQTGIVILQYPNGVDFGDGNIAKLVIGIAAAGDEHMDILMKIADAVSNEETLNYLTTETDSKAIYDMFVKSGLGGK